MEEEIVYGYLKSIYNTILLKDVVARYNIRDIDFLERLVEYLVYNQLITEDYNVFIGKHQDREIDFVAIKGNDIKYVQVAYQLPDKKVREREFGNLLKIEDNYEKIVVSADEFAVDYKGIRHLHIRKFLNNEA